MTRRRSGCSECGVVLPVDCENHVSATPEAVELIERLRASHGPVVLVQSGGCCDGSSPVCLREGDLLLGPGDLRIGEVAGAGVYIDGDQFERWGRPDLTIDVASEAGDTFSLAGLEGVHFVLGSDSRVS